MKASVNELFVEHICQMLQVGGLCGSLVSILVPRRKREGVGRKWSTQEKEFG